MANAVNFVRYIHTPGETDLQSIFAVTLSGSYATGGETVSLATAANPNGIEGGGWPPQSLLPDDVVEVTNVTNAAGVQLYPSAYSAASFQLQVFTTSAGVELSAGAYPAGLTTGVVLIKVRGRI